RKAVPRIGIPPKRRDSGPNPACIRREGHRDSAPPQRRPHSPSHGQTGGERTGGTTAEKNLLFLCIAYQNLTGEGVSGKRFRLQNLPQIFVCSPGKIPLEFLKLPV